MSAFDPERTIDVEFCRDAQRKSLPAAMCYPPDSDMADCFAGLAVPPAGHANDFASDLPIDRRTQEQDHSRNVLRCGQDARRQHAPDLLLILVRDALLIVVGQDEARHDHAEVAIHHLIVNRETLHPGALAPLRSTKADYVFLA